jgi:hypothetical protein
MGESVPDIVSCVGLELILKIIYKHNDLRTIIKLAERWRRFAVQRMPFFLGRGIPRWQKLPKFRSFEALLQFGEGFLGFPRQSVRKGVVKLSWNPLVLGALLSLQLVDMVHPVLGSLTREDQIKVLMEIVHRFHADFIFQSLLSRGQPLLQTSL